MSIVKVLETVRLIVLGSTTILAIPFGAEAGRLKLEIMTVKSKIESRNFGNLSIMNSLQSS